MRNIKEIDSNKISTLSSSTSLAIGGVKSENRSISVQIDQIVNQIGTCFQAIRELSVHTASCRS